MKITKRIKVEVSFLKCDIGVRYWEDGTVNGVEDEDGELIPCREGKRWCPKIDLKTGKIINWKQGVTASLHYKVCDDGIYTLTDADGDEVKSIEDYVPTMMCPEPDGYGDYIIMNINEDGFIDNWRADASGFETNRDCEED